MTEKTIWRGGADASPARRCTRFAVAAALVACSVHAGGCGGPEGGAQDGGENAKSATAMTA